MNTKNSNKKRADPKVRRTSISETGKITKSEIPLSELKKEAIDLSADSHSPTTLLLTRDAAIRITEQAISIALDSAFSNNEAPNMKNESKPFRSEGDKNNAPSQQPVKIEDGKMHARHEKSIKMKAEVTPTTIPEIKPRMGKISPTSTSRMKRNASSPPPLNNPNKKALKPEVGRTHNPGKFN